MPRTEIAYLKGGVNRRRIETQIGIKKYLPNNTKRHEQWCGSTLNQRPELKTVSSFARK